MPGANARAMEKARDIPCDAIIFDLEDAVSPDSKASARHQIGEALQTGGYGDRELVVRCNGLDTPWGAEDVMAFAGAQIAALLFPKIEAQQQIVDIVDLMEAHGGSNKPIWLMIETPRGVLDLRNFADHPRVEVLVMGTSDLVKELHAEHTETRHNLDYALQSCVLVARTIGKDILDGVHLDFRDKEAFRQVCTGGRQMGFDGKTLIHPTQVQAANEIFGYSDAEIAEAQATLDVWEAALAEGKGVAVLDGKLVENLHAAEAERIMSFARALRRQEPGGED